MFDLRIIILIISILCFIFIYSFIKIYSFSFNYRVNTFFIKNFFIRRSKSYINKNFIFYINLLFIGELNLKLKLFTKGVSKIGRIDNSLKGEIILVKYSLENGFLGVVFLYLSKILYLQK